MVGIIDLSEAKRVLDASARLPHASRAPKTFLEVAGIQWRELPITKILGFFMDAREEHELGDLVLRALLTSAGYSFTNTAFSVEEVVVELPTGNDNRIGCGQNARLIPASKWHA